MRVPLLILGLFVVAGALPARAAENQAEQTLVYPCRPAAGPVVVDGRLDPAEWAGAVEVSGFRVSGSETLAPEQVTMRLLYDHDMLYVGVKCLESNMKGLKAAVRDHDGAFWTDDAVEFFLDPLHDHETTYQFALAAGGGLYDNSKGDSLWNSAWKAVMQRAEDFWTVEAAVPFSELKVAAPAPGALWGFNLCREREAGGKLELYNWADVQRVFNKAPLYGHLRFVGAGWQPTPASIAAAAKDAGGRETLVFAPDGYWRVKAGGQPEALSYRALLQAQGQGVTPQFKELQGFYEKSPRLAFRADFDQLNAGYGRVQALAAGTGPISAEEWAHSKAFLDHLEGRVEAIYWRVRLALLNETL